MKLRDLRRGLAEMEPEAAAERVGNFLDWLQDNLDGLKGLSPRVARELLPIIQRLATAQNLLEEGEYDDKQ